MFLLYIALAALTVFFVIKTSQFYSRYSRDKKLLAPIPAPPATSILGHVGVFMQNPDDLFTRIRKFSKEYSPIYRFSTPYVNIVNFLEPSDIELVLSTTKHLSKSKIYSFLYNWLGTGLLTSTGAKWHTRRKILTPAFHFSILQQFLGIFNDETTKLIEKLSTETGNIIDVVPPVTNFTLQSIAETAMGLSTIDESTQKEYKKAIHSMGRLFLRRLTKPWYRINAVYNMTKLAQEENAIVKVLHDFSNRIITEREKERTTNISSSLSEYSKKKRLAMLDLLLAAKNEGADIDYEGIREEVDTFMFEGHDTTSMAISFMLLTLANLQDIQAKIVEEIVSVIGPSKIPTYTDLQELKYTERYASEDFITKTGYYITEGTVLHVHIFDVHRTEKIYPDPLKFDPDRFLPENVSQRHPFAYIPFSAGPRNCIGQRFALLEMKTVLCGILRRFKLEKVDDMYEIEFRPDLVLRPKNDIKVKILTRE